MKCKNFTSRIMKIMGLNQSTKQILALQLKQCVIQYKKLENTIC